MKLILDPDGIRTRIRYLGSRLPVGPQVHRLSVPVLWLSLTVIGQPEMPGHGLRGGVLLVYPCNHGLGAVLRA